MKKLLLIFLILTGYIYCDTLNVLFLGDTHFGENYQYEPKFDRGVNVIEEYGYDYFFENVKDILSGSDITFCNLETPLTNDRRNPVSYIKPYLHWSDPDSTVKYFNKYGIKYVTLGNNHVFDYGLPGFIETQTALNSGGIKFFGAGDNSFEAAEPLIKNINGYKLIIFGGFEFREKYDTLYDFYADSIKTGVNKLDTLILSSQIKSYRQIYPDAIIIIYPHWGSNYKPRNDMQKACAHNWIDSGADYIIGQGAHTIQEAEKYKGKWIFYNLGNFIFNAPGRYTSTGAKPYGMMLKLVFIENERKIIIYPLYTNNHETDYCLRKLDDYEFNDFTHSLLQGKYESALNEDNSIILR
ncbi:MAG: CapA family protein [Ignavibacteria bacterium]